MILALIGAVECATVGINLLRPLFAVEDHRALVLSASLATGFVGSVALYVFMTHLLGRKRSLRVFRISAAVLLVLAAIQIGVMATLVAFGDASPWGYVVSGISGPLFGWLNGVVSTNLWPVPFVLGFFGTVGIITRLWKDATKKGFLTTTGVRA